MTAQLNSMPEAQRQRWLRYEASVQALRVNETERGARIAERLRTFPGYYSAAVERNQELLRLHQNRPELRWAWEQWRDIFETGGLDRVLAMCAEPITHQELISSSPFCLMRPPLPENDYYRQHESADA